MPCYTRKAWTSWCWISVVISLITMWVFFSSGSDQVWYCLPSATIYSPSGPRIYIELHNFWSVPVFSTIRNFQSYSWPTRESDVCLRDVAAASLPNQATHRIPVMRIWLCTYKSTCFSLKGCVWKPHSSHWRFAASRMISPLYWIIQPCVSWQLFGRLDCRKFYIMQFSKYSFKHQTHTYLFRRPDIEKQFL